MPDSIPSSQSTNQLSRTELLKRGIIADIHQEIARSHEERRPFQGEETLERLEAKDTPSWFNHAIEELASITLQQIPSIEDNDSLIGFIETILATQIDTDALDFSDTDEARNSLRSHLSQAITEGGETVANIEDMLDKAKSRYQELQNKGELRLDLSNTASLKKAVDTQETLRTNMEKMKAQPQTGSALIAILGFSPEIEERQFRSVERFYEYCRQERDKQKLPLKFSLDTLRKVCTKIGLNFRAL